MGPGDHGHWMRLIPHAISGRRIVPGQLPPALRTPAAGNSRTFGLVRGPFAATAVVARSGIVGAEFVAAFTPEHVPVG
jgi:hypothetical protein